MAKPAPRRRGTARAEAVRSNTAAPRPDPRLRRARRELDGERARSQKLHFLVETSKLLHSTLDLFELFGIVLRVASQQTGAERATLFLVDAPRRQLLSLIAQGLERKEIRLPIGRGVAGWVAETGRTVNLPDAYRDPRFDARFDQSFGFRTRSLLAMPVKDRAGRIVAVLELLNAESPPFTDADVAFVESISVHAAIALENARLHREEKERQRLDRDLAVARTIQRALLPDAPPRLDGVEIAVRHQASHYVGGDYYDFLPLGEGVQVFVVADVEGKGAASALVMSSVQASLHVLVQHVHSLEGILFHLNETLRKGTRGEKYVTVFLGLLDVPRRRVHYINAGHQPPLVFGPAGTEPLAEGGMALGLFPQVRFKRGVRQLEPGEVLVACTDGIVEASDALEQQYGSERLAAVVRGKLGGSAQEIVDAIFADVDRHAEGGGRHDDRVAMAIKIA